MLRRVWWPVCVSAVLLAGCGLVVPNPPKVLPSTIDGNTLPPAALAALNDKWPKHGWQMTTVDPQVASCLPAGTPAKEVVTADFDSDGMSDIAATVQTSAGVRLVVLMARTWGYDVYDVDAVGDKLAKVSLGMEPRGKRFINADTKAVNNYSSETLTTYACGQPKVSYLWSGYGYYKVTIGQQ